jgi:hypothetical protein
MPIVPDIPAERTPSDIVYECRGLISTVASSSGRSSNYGNRARDRLDLLLDHLQRLAEGLPPGASVDANPVRFQWRLRRSDDTFTEWADCSEEMLKKITGKRMEKRSLGVIKGTPK